MPHLHPAPYKGASFLVETPHMKFILSLLIALSLAALAVSPTAASAQTVQARLGYVPSEGFEGAAALSNTSYTNATTTPTVLTGTALVLPATTVDPTTQLLTACWSADATKSTATTGNIGVYADGVVVAGSQRYISSAAARGTLGGCFSWFRATASATTIALYAASADTNSFAVQNAQVTLVVRRILPSR